MAVRKPRAVRPDVVTMESRQLLSGITASLSALHPHDTAIDLLSNHIHADAGGGAGGSGGGGQGGGGSGRGGTPTTVPPSNGNGFANNSSSPLLGQGNPTPAELAREAFRATFSGRYYPGPGRFSDQGTTYFYRGLGTSSVFLHGDFNMAIVTPTDPAAPFIGEAVLNDKNTNSSAIQGLILSGNRTDVDAQGRPTRMYYQADPNVYSGAFFVNAAQGAVDIKYGAHKAITVAFNGRLYTNGLANPLVNQDLYARQGRPVPFHGPSTRNR